MKILLISVPIREGEPPGLYLGLAYIASVLEKDGYQVNVLDINGHRWERLQIINKIKSLDFDVVGIGAMITSFKYLKWLIPTIKKICPNKKIIVGGPITSTTSELLFKRTPVDVCVIGEGEETSSELFKALEKNRPLNNINGLKFREKNKIITTPPRERIKNLDTLPFPAYHLFDMNLYFGQKVRENRGKRAIAMLAGRGCPFRCVYCKRNFGNTITLRSVDNIIREMRELKKNYKIEYFIFIDELFILNKQRVFEFCDKLDKSNLKVKWGCEGRVNIITKEILERMKKSGCVDVGYGIESLSQRTLNEMNKGVTVEQAKRAIRITKRSGLYQVNTLMVGMPGDTKQRVMETVKNYKNLDVLPDTLFFTCLILEQNFMNRLSQK